MRTVTRKGKNMKKQVPILILGRHPEGIADLAIDADRTILTAGPDGTIRRWKTDLSEDADLAKPLPEPVIRFSAAKHYKGSPPVQMSAMSMDRAGQVLACGLKHGVVELRDLRTGLLIRELENPQAGSRHPYDFCRVMFNPSDSNQLLGTNRNYVNVWDTASGAILWSDHQYRAANTAAFLRGGSRLFVQEWDPWLHLFEWPGAKRIRWQYELMESSYNFLTTRPAPEGAVFDLILAALDADGAHVVAMNIDQEEAVWETALPDRQHDVDIAPGGKFVVTGGEDGMLRVLSKSGKEDHVIDVDDHPMIGAEARAAGPAKSSGTILTTNDLEEDFFPPTAIHRVKLLDDANAVVGLAGGLLVRLSW
jgi:WD40 repeat protein